MPAEFPTAQALLDQLVPKELAGQLFMPAAFINESEAEIRKLEALIQDHNIGGLCFFHSRASAATNFEGKQEIPFNPDSLGTLKALIARYQAAARFPLLIAIDAEWGLAMRVEHTPHYPYALALGALDDDDPLLYQTGLRMAADCREAGIHWNLAPVADCNTNPKNPVIGYRSFGSDPDAVAGKAVAFFRGLRDGGLLGCAKHFPGHGDTATDSHLALPVLRKSKQALAGEELIPFHRLIEAGVPAVMTGHLSVPELDPTGAPASLSRPIIQGLLREALGYEGVVITDALNMHAVSKRETEPGMTALRAHQAGNDLLCFAEDIPEALDRIVQESDPAVLEMHFRRVWALKEAVFGTKNQPVRPRFTPEALNRKLAQNCLTALVGHPALASHFRNAEFGMVGCGATTRPFEDLLEGEAKPGTILDWDLTGQSPEAFPLPPEQKVVLALAPPSLKPPNCFGISEPARQAIGRLLEQRDVLVYHFGNPYALEVLPIGCAKSVTIAYQPLPAFQEAAALHFLGTLPAPGRLAVPLNTDTP